MARSDTRTAVLEEVAERLKAMARETRAAAVQKVPGSAQRHEGLANALILEEAADIVRGMA